MSEKPQKLSIVIPCFNEPENVSLVISRLKELIAQKDYLIEVIFVDGCSTDETPKVLEKEFEELEPSNFKLILMEERKGYGHDILYALSQASGDVLSWTHADMQTDPDDVLKAFDLYKSQDKENVFIKGRRRNRRLLEAFFSFGMQIATWFILKTYLDDINAQPKLFSKEFYGKHLENDAPNDFSLDLYAMYKAKKNGYAILDFPVYFAKREHGEAKGGGGSWKSRVKLIKRTFSYILKLKRNMEK